MPSINEVWEQALQINANLGIIHNDMVDLQNCCQATNDRLNQLIVRSDETNDWLAEVRSLVSRGFAEVTTGIAGIHDRQEILIQLAVHQIAQNRTIICALEKISRNTCELLNEAHRQTELQTDIQQSTAATAHMMGTAHPDAALVYAREQAQKKAIEECCPPREPENPCTYQPCDEPDQPDVGRLRGYEPFKDEPTRVVRVKRPQGPD